MIRALWTASSGMNAQQLNIDTVANNLANVNTTVSKIPPGISGSALPNHSGSRAVCPGHDDSNSIAGWTWGKAGRLHQNLRTG